MKSSWQGVVKSPILEWKGRSRPSLLPTCNQEYGEVEVIDDEEEELIEVTFISKATASVIKHFECLQGSIGLWIKTG